ncbi:hypothetical protein AMK68_01165 [candidate division KD3-62 bacterium DG_56]|uniref:Polysaccharide pyruvyl transferase domain-containing protein n=1 Tax=candidate division KD3-62 bacterium DG_56 TaxID=1704032 RepID=A0A0S7XQG2_9BACT|nr:MAG: hypothetical protein AMK68_01165 [candidate division KD3-62 bacterium DG_56]
MARRVVISGYYGFGNAGDEAILAGIVAGFRELAPDVQLVVLSATPQETAAEHGVECVDRARFGDIGRAIDGADLLISGGGGLLQDVTSWRSPLYYLHVIRLARKRGKPVMLFAQGIGPLRRRLIRTAVRWTLKDVQAISVRDRQSVEELERLRVAGPPVEVTADPAFLISPASAGRVKDIVKRENLSAAGGRRLLVNVRDWRGPTASARARANLITELASALDTVAAEEKAEIVFLPMQRGDADLAGNVLAAMVAPGNVVLGEYSPSEIAALAATAGVVVAIRLHALMFAVMAGVTPVGISYDPKVDAFLGSLDLTPAAQVGEIDGAGLAAAIRAAMASAADFRPHLLEAAGRQRELALENVRMALALM